MNDGAAQMAKLGHDLKQAGNRDLRLEMLRSGRRLGAPVKAEITASALAELPKRGGLAALIAAANIRTSVRLSGRSVGVKFIGKWSGHDLEGLDEGLDRHPVYQRAGRKPPWVAQAIHPGYWSRVFAGPAAKQARNEWLKAIDAVIVKLRAGG